MCPKSGLNNSCWRNSSRVQAEEILNARNLDKEYLPMSGNPEFTKAAAKLAYGPDSLPFSQNSVRSSHSYQRCSVDLIRRRFLLCNPSQGQVHCVSVAPFLRGTTRTPRSFIFPCLLGATILPSSVIVASRFGRTDISTRSP
jgi:hypothetical protein